MIIELKILNALAFSGNVFRNVTFILQTTEYYKQKGTLSVTIFLSSFICKVRKMSFGLEAELHIPTI